jgi:RimJ/RimL family protein N-acetyltransferase
VVWQVLMLGTDIDHRERGLAESLKREIMRRAKDAGIRSLVSLVDRRNATMIALNERLGGKCVWDWRDPEHSRCAVPVR